MSDLKAITCSSCGAGKFEHDSEGSIVCTHCGTKYASAREEIMCGACGTINPGNALRCMKCGLNLGKLCPACNHLNAPGTENCMNCATPLDALASISMRHGEGKRRSDALREEILVNQKGADMAYMDQQRRYIDDEEKTRQGVLSKQRQAGVRQQRVLVFIALGIVVLLVVAALVMSNAFPYK